MVTPLLAPASPATAGGRRSAARPLVAVVVIAVVQVLLVLLFSWSSSRAAPHDVPIAVAGPAPAAQGVAQGLAAAKPGAFAVRVLPDDAAARAAVTDRTVSGALVLGPSGGTLYTASAASPTVAQLLAEVFPQVLQGARPGAAVTVTDLVPAPADDPHGAGIPTGLIPLTITSIVAGAVVGLLAPSRRIRFAALGGYALLAGTLAALALQTTLGVLTGPWAVDAGVLALAGLAVSAATAGLIALIGPAGAVVSILVVFFFGFPFSGATTAVELVPTPWGALAGYLPVGATNVGLRSVAFFDGAGGGGPLLVLACWAALGLAACLVRRPPIGGRTGSVAGPVPGESAA